MNQEQKQRVFDLVVAHWKKQGRVAMGEDNKCQYRTPDGLKCFIGALIPDGVDDAALRRNVCFADLRSKPIRDYMESSFGFDGGDYHQRAACQRRGQLRAIRRWLDGGLHDGGICARTRPAVRILRSYHGTCLRGGIACCVVGPELGSQV